MKIKELTLGCANLQNQESFYRDTLGFPVVRKDVGKISFRIGASVLTFIESTDFTPYHFAFNTTSWSEIEMHEFLITKVEILKYHGQEIVDFPNWNAHSIYFYDADKNIVEFISRNNLAYKRQDVFGINSIVEISEIGLPTSDVAQIYQMLQDKYKLEVYDGDSDFEKFSAIGDEHGLFICINKNLKKWIPTNDEAYPSEFIILFEQNNHVFKLAYKADKLIHVVTL